MNKNKNKITSTYFKNVQRKLEIEETIVDCIQSLLGEEDLHKAMMTVLDYILNYYKADRAYVFEFDWENNLSSNTYEKCRDNVKSEKNNLQSISTFIMPRWISEFNKNNAMIIENLEDIKNLFPEEYETLFRQNIHSLIAVPFKINHEILGFLGVDNPSDLSKGEEFLCSLSYFIINELTKRKMDSQLKYLSYHDSLTGLYNRNKFTEYVSNFNNDNISSIGVIFADINGLKEINDTYGHKYGDNFIKSVSNKLKSIFKEYLNFRLSGDEFVVLCENIHKRDFLKKISSLKTYQTFEHTNDMSFGYIWKDSDINITKLINIADDLMYLNKQEFYKKNLLNTNNHIPLLLKNLLNSITNKEFVIFLQPKMNLKTGAICGAEALARHINPNLGIVHPEKFIPIFEKEKTIHYIDFFILEETCKILSRWMPLSIGSFKVSLNFSRITLMEDNLLSKVIKICDKYKVPKNFIEIEITENVAEVEQDYIATITADLKKAGFGLSLDDFGSKYSSLDMITMLDIDVLKIDKSLIKNIIKSKKNNILIKNIINTCHDMNIKCLAEGVENKEQLNVLGKMNCDFIQGYILNKPISVPNFEENYILKEYT